VWCFVLLSCRQFYFNIIFYTTAAAQPHRHTTATHPHPSRNEQRNHCKICKIWYGLARRQTYQELYPMQSRILFDKTKTPLSKMWPYILSFLH
jgi:hypothetical protein